MLSTQLPRRRAPLRVGQSWRQPRRLFCASRSHWVPAANGVSLTPIAMGSALQVSAARRRPASCLDAVRRTCSSHQRLRYRQCGQRSRHRHHRHRHRHHRHRRSHHRRHRLHVLAISCAMTAAEGIHRMEIAMMEAKALSTAFGATLAWIAPTAAHAAHPILRLRCCLRLHLFAKLPSTWSSFSTGLGPWTLPWKA